MGKICENCDWKDGDFCPHMLDCKNYSEFTPKQKTGHWIKQTLSVKPFGEDTVLCDRCAYMTDKDNNFNFCPNCGAKMDEEAADDR